MTYHRFLTNKDYDCIATHEHMRQLIRDEPERVPQAEQRAEMQIMEYLDQYYEIEKVLAVGKNIREYNVGITYPGQIWIRKDEVIYKTLTRINGRKKPTKVVYWKQVDDFVPPHLIDHAKKYSQLCTYAKGEIVRFGTEYWQCVTPHGYSAGKIHTPGINAWKEVEVTPWEPNLEWEKDQVCSFNGLFYQYLGVIEDEDGMNDNTSDENGAPDPDPEIDEEDITQTNDEINEGGKEPEEGKSDGESDASEDENVLTPEDDDSWGLIGEYSEELEYDYSEDVRDYVVAEDTVFYPMYNPNPDALEEGVNITRDDPRNANIVAHLSRIALYHLHSIIAPTNVPETRRWAYEDSIQWLYNASKFKINPQLPRKREKDSCVPKVDWACETFQRSYDPNENPWLI